MKLTTAQINNLFGKPCDQSNFVKMQLPFPMRLAWDLKTKVTSVTVHKAIAHQLYGALLDIFYHYGLGKIQELGIDIFGGILNCRKVRGGAAKSRHSWAIAIDLDPERNGLKVKWANANFSKPVYQFVIKAFYKWGFINYGKEYDFDAMHFEVIKILPKAEEPVLTKPDAGISYTVKAGDTLGIIARNTNTTLQAIMAKNPTILNPNAIRVGQKIWV
jgi:LysM repeat protein